MRPSASIFNRGFRTAFNQNKYMNLTGHGNTTPTHLGWISLVDYRFGRVMLYLTFLVGGFQMYIDPGYLHETFGHSRQPPKYVVNFGKGLESDEKKLNKQILERHAAEEKLEHFKHDINAFDGK